MIDSIRDVQILVALNEKSDLCRTKLNTGLQGLLNPSGESVEGVKYRVGDKVICLRNGARHLNWDHFAHGNSPPRGNESVYVANGETGIVIEVSKTHIAVAFPRISMPVAFSRGEWLDVDLAYAITCHKSQGGSSPVIIVMADDYMGASLVTSINWYLTALSRASEIAITIGKMSTILKHCEKEGVGSRKTFLRERIRRAIGCPGQSRPSLSPITES